MNDPVISVVNESSSISNEDFFSAVAACQRQVTEHLGPIWKTDARLCITPRGVAPLPDSWVVTIVEESPKKGARGFHEDNVLPSAIVAVQKSISEGYLWTRTLSHEIVEMVVNPWCALTYRIGGYVYALEIADPVAGNCYDINGVAVSNFVTESWYDLDDEGPWDYMKVLGGPLEFGPGGYCSTAKVTEWRQEGSSFSEQELIPTPWSRRNRYIMGM